MSKLRWFVLVVGMASLAGTDVGSNQAEAHYAYRQYYDTSWSYNTTYSYHYRRYYYKPTVQAVSYSYHYTIYYPSRPRYVYYYNPVKRYYWGRYDLEDKGYSMLKEEDRKEKLTDIKEEAFPKPAAMPAIPDADDNVKIEVPPNDLPKK
ncbi:MAG: hypothetical protein K8T89_09875 [Planctomycetes bacterium]|nr:hypothetical protein [Planctomycetota bacterium]